MRLLLDTHAFFWIAQPAYRTPAHVVEALAVADRVAVSDASAFEVSLKVHLGKFDGARALLGDWPIALERLDAEALRVNTEHAITAGSLDWAHRDPFDRLIVGQAVVEGLTLVTADQVVQRAPGVAVLAW